MQMVCVFLLHNACTGYGTQANRNAVRNLSSCTLVLSALYARPTKLLSQMPFSSLNSLVLSMRLRNPLNAPAFLASLTWQQHPRHALPFCVGELALIYLLSGYYIKIEIKRDPDHPLCIFEWVLWLLGVDAAGL